MSFRIFRNWFCVFIALFFLPLKTPAFASTWVTGAMFDNNFSVTVEPQQSIKATINVSTWFDNSDSNDTANWSSTQYTFSGQNSVCVDTANFFSSDFHQNIFDFLSPSDEGTYNITLKAFSNENCTGGAIAKSLTLTNVITVVDTTPPVITIKPYNLNPTDQNITVVASTNEGVLNFSSYTFTQNGSFEFIATDPAGNISRKTITVTNINKNSSSTTNNTNNSSNNTNTNTFTTNTTNEAKKNFSYSETKRFNLPVPTINFQLPKTDINENISTPSGQILGTTDIHNGCWLPILFIIALVINFFFVRYSTKFTTLIPFTVSLLSFSIDYLMLKKYGCDISLLSNYFWVGEILSFLTPVTFKHKISRR